MTLRVGFVGCGNITQTHARACLDAGLEASGFYGRDPRKAEALAQRYGGRAFPTYEALLGHPIDCVVIGSPSGLHAEHGIAAAEHGRHVLVEKPIDVSVARGEALVRAAERNGVVLGVLFQDRLKPGLLRLRDFVQAGGLGRVLLVSAHVKWYRPAEYYSTAPWRGTLALDGGAALINQGIHTVDLLLWLLGPVAQVRALTRRQLHRIEGEDVALALLEFASGVVGTFEATTVAWPGFPRRIEITGTEGTLAVEGDHVVSADLRVPAPGLVENAAHDAENARTAVVSDVTAHRRMIENFVHAVEGRGNPACDGREGLRSLALVEAIYVAARVGAEAPS